jgi:hypothetical protein
LSSGIDVLAHQKMMQVATLATMVGLGGDIYRTSAA